MTPDLEAAIRALLEVARRAQIEAVFSPEGRGTLAIIDHQLPMTEELLAWYETSAPRDAEIPQFPEYLRLYDLVMLFERQNGYRWPVGRRGVVDPGWNPCWLVIGDYSGDPLIAHTDEAGTPISMAAHGAGGWQPYRMAPSLAAYLAALAIWIEVSVIAYRGVIRDDDSVVLPEFHRDLNASFAQVLAPEYRRNWLERNA